MAEVNWSDQSKKDLRAIAEYFGQSSQTYAQYIVTNIYSSVSELKEHPKIGRKVPELDLEFFRERIVEDYRIIYLLQENFVEVMTIVHSRQDLLRYLKRKD
jgi:addiction module RelE/StbE family toxin